MIAQDELNEVADYVSSHGLSEDVFSELRNKYKGKHFTWCIEDDIHSGNPVLTRDNFSIYLVNSKDHCSVLTNDMESASGYVLAEIIADD